MMKIVIFTALFSAVLAVPLFDWMPKGGKLDVLSMIERSSLIVSGTIAQIEGTAEKGNITSR